MKKLFLLSGVAALIFGLSACKGTTGADSADQLKNFPDSLAYFFGASQGLSMAQNIERYEQQSDKKIDRKQFLAGLKSMLNCDSTQTDYMQGAQFGMQIAQMANQLEEAGVKFNRDLFYSQFVNALNSDSIDQARVVAMNDQLQPLFYRAQSLIQKKQMEAQMAAQEKADKEFNAAKEEGAAYIEKLKKEDPSIVTTESGLSYKVIEQGTGDVAQPGDKVKVIYAGQLINGKEFDSSDGETVEFTTNQVIPGWTEALTTLPAGTKVKLYIPENLAYGRRSTPEIPAGSTLVFDLTIVGSEAPATK